MCVQLDLTMMHGSVCVSVCPSVCVCVRGRDSENRMSGYITFFSLTQGLKVYGETEMRVSKAAPSSMWNCLSFKKMFLHFSIHPFNILSTEKKKIQVDHVSSGHV